MNQNRTVYRVAATIFAERAFHAIRLVRNIVAGADDKMIGTDVAIRLLAGSASKVPQPRIPSPQILSFPGSAWERHIARLRLAGAETTVAAGVTSNQRPGRRSLPSSAFPGRAWEREGKPLTIH